MPNMISKEAALDKIHNLIKLLQGYKPYHPVTLCYDDTILVLD